jgi:hypothetical protein
MEPEATCGTGIAEHSILPSKLADLTASMAVVLEVHQQALDRTDTNSQQEFEAYQQVGQALRRSASQLKATSSQMAASRTVPMGKHDTEALSSPQAVQAFAAFVLAEQELLNLLQDRLEQDQRTLIDMRGSVSGRRDG